MKNLIFSAICLFSMLAFTSCDDDDNLQEGVTTSLALNFNAKYNSSDLNSASLTYHNYGGDKQIRFQRFDFYISNVSLYRNGETDVTELIEIDYVNLDDKNVDTKNVASVPIGSYDGIQFELGVVEDYNNMSPGDFSSGHPLSTNYWAGWQSYIFCRLEGNLDLVGMGNLEDEVGFTYHMGTNDLLRTIQLSKPITLTEGQAGDVDLFVDVRRALFDNDEFWDIESFNQTHDPSDSDHVLTATNIMDNLTKAISIE